ncbi:MAG TPA: hypothetical protein VGN77_06210 [Steroidobacteraceae bacterium]|nr:hypothetical protein [Steroidobacteraceae bacterium]
MSNIMALRWRAAANSGPMNSKDTFMRFVVLGSIVVVGAFALFVTLRS